MDATESEIINLTGGPLLMSTVINWGLFGVLSLQVFLFSQAFPNDRSIFKAMVYGVYLLEMGQTIALTASAWATFVQGVGHNVDSLSTFVTIEVSVSLLGAVTAMVVQTFYAYRIMVISENKIIPLFITMMSLTSFIAEVVVAVIIEQAKKFELVQLHTLKTADFIGLRIGTSCICDILIAACMCFYLSRRIRDGIFPKTRALVSRAMRMTIETGALTASVSIGTLAIFYVPALGNFIYYTVPLATLGKLHSNAMLALLNSRIKLGIISESTTWHENNELPLIPMSQPRRTDDIEIKFASCDTSESASDVRTKKEVIAMDGEKFTPSGPHSCEEITTMDSENIV